ncbi:fimbria/pilus periplasmic chaperone [uncultured Brevundimonas sp.]|uniref:fimbria/pilus periplasmic chaperone n=1 Tax=uncultured Brevundimonas sp. TaxID=213418 RepID=UPI0025E0541C|nr:fimbria/pilus periplasmic chaperone [uncultured Brevundimonas sp.]
MFGGGFRILKAFGLASAALLVSGLPVAALNVQPVVLDLLTSGRRSSAVVTLQNTFTTTVPVELVARPVELVDGEFRETDQESEDLLIFPATATVEPGQSQAFRVQWVGDPAPTGSRHYYVSVAQLPIQLPENENAIQVLYNFKVLVSVGPNGASPDLKIASAAIETDADGKSRPVIQVSNAGATYGYVGRGRMTITQRAPDGAVVFRESYEPDEIQRRMGLGLIPSGASRRLPINVDLPRADGAVVVDIAPVEGR